MTEFNATEYNQAIANHVIRIKNSKRHKGGIANHRRLLQLPLSCNLPNGIIKTCPVFRSLVVIYTSTAAPYVIAAA